MVDTIKVIIAADAGKYAEKLKVLLSQQSSLSIQVQDTVETRQAVQTARNLRPNVALLIDEEARTPMVDICREIDQKVGGTVTIVLAKEATQAQNGYFRRMMQSGVRDVLPLPPLVDTLVHSIQQVVPEPPDDGTGGIKGNGQVVTVYSPKGGAGCSLFAANLGVWQAKRSADARVVLFDLDLDFGDQVALLDLEPTHSLDDLLRVVDDDLTLDNLEKTFTRHPSGLRVLAAPPDPYQAQPLNEASVRKIIGALRTYYDLVIIDTHTALSPILFTALDFADLIVQICTPDVPSIRRTRTILRLYNKLGISQEKVRLVLNRTHKHDQIKPAEINLLFKPEIIGEIPEDFLFLQPFVNSGLPFVDARQQKSPALKNFGKLAESLLAALRPKAAVA